MLLNLLPLRYPLLFLQTKDLKVLAVPPVLPDHLVLLAHQEYKEARGLQVQRVRLALPERPAQRVLQALRAPLGRQDPLVLLEIPDLPVRPA